ncbi:DUF6898 family protein [Hansschlegelia beijingensis]|uniref:DUF6898 domain-containing protein n=1 Tax=Hansschlegelia beijingensis TaxID=1133344 RepID=A0A7W6D8V7_9HYPH|nr:hypothetical protein [Hansschlegelia beijingensis]
MRRLPGDSPARRDVATPGEVLFEFVVRGGAARCAAIDAATGVEVVVVGPAAASEAHLKAVALRKLRLRLARE